MMGEDKFDRVYVSEVPSTALGARKLGDLLKEFDGLYATLNHPETGKEYRVSLEPWSDRDRDTTYIQIHFRGNDPSRVRRIPNQRRHADGARPGPKPAT